MFGQAVLYPDRGAYLATVESLRDEGYCTATDLTVVDYLTHPGRSGLPGGVQPERFEVVVGLFDHARRERVRLRIQVPADDPTVPSLFDLFPGTEAMEREAWDLFGVSFEGHPDHSRILLPEDWVGHPLRKDEGIGAIPVQFKSASDRR
ncbi:MAG TPA: NADH-quinone oxidoreductase subunit C [Acidimicrobiaceae bacterium]|nr:NADH-quinone oxidoreductase subunit C [Acidimicrobiaceae bacterium]HBM57439.1 NADH-quinone oxidoreductase subunit C [Acidimicrobiaceae bacterium]